MTKGYALREIFNQRDSLVRIGQYENNKASSITIMQHRHQTSKADSINEIQKYKLIKNSRTLTIDSDTILDPRFMERMNENWYTLRIYRNRVVVNEAEILDATVLPKKNPWAGLQERAIAMAREAEYTCGQILGIILSLYRRNRLQESSVVKCVRYSLLKSIPIFFFLYILRFIDSVQFLTTILKKLKMIAPIKSFLKWRMPSKEIKDFLKRNFLAQLRWAPPLPRCQATW